MDDIAYIGLDVHLNSITVAVAAGDGSEVRLIGKIANDRKSIDGLLKGLLGRWKELHVFYEAGPMGYGLYRYLRKKGVRCSVVAPSLIPRRAGDRVKTDPRDAQALARLGRAGELTEIWVPDEEQEALRDLTRLRDDARLASKRAKQNLLGFLRRHERVYKGTKSRWTKDHFEWLSGLKFEHLAQQLVVQDYVNAVKKSQERVFEIEEEMRKEFEKWSWRPIAEATMALRGIDFITAMSILTETGDLRRFNKPSMLMSYVGLVPSEYSSGERRRLGSITKSGNTHVRRLLIEAAWSARYKPARTTHWRKRAACCSEEVQAISWKAMKRLHRVYWRLVAKKKAPSKAVVAVARELTGFVWSVAQTAYAEQEAKKA